ncbi:hypothetical protein N9I36_00380 [Planktomarina temperata]|nr:hypothetical protein [Planktomarina temperata]
MAWRNTNPSDYAPKSNAIGEALTGFASVYAPAKIAKDKREAEIAYEKEKADAKTAADAAEKAADKELQDKKDAKIVSIILREQNLNPKKVSSNVRLDILKDVQIMGKDAITYYSDPTRQFTPEYVYGSSAIETVTPLVDASVSNVPKNNDTSSALTDKSSLDKETETLFPETNSNNINVGTDSNLPSSRYKSVLLTTKEIIELEQAGRIAALNDPTVSAENKKRITNWQTANQSILDAEAEKIPYGDIKIDNYIQIAAEFENNPRLKNGKELAQKVTALGKILVQSSNKPLTLPEINQLDLDVLEGSVKAGELEESQAKLFKQIIASKYNKIGRELSKLDDDDLQGIRDNIGFQPLENRNAADAILKGRKTTFDIKDWKDVSPAVLEVAILYQNNDTIKEQLIALRDNNEVALQAEWIAEASKSKDNAFSAIVQYTALDEPGKLAIAKAMYTSFVDNDVPYKSLLQVDTLIGKDSKTLIEIKDAAVELGATDKDLKFIVSKIENIQDIEKSEEGRKYIEASTSRDKTLSQLRLAEENGASENIITALEELATEQQKGNINVALAQNGQVGAFAVDSVYTDPNTGILRYGVLIAQPDGTRETYPDGIKVEDARSMTDSETAQFQKIAVQSNKYYMAASEANVAIAEGLRTTEYILDLARNNDMVREFGGDVAQGLTNFVRGGSGTFKVLESLFKGRPLDYVVTEDQLRAATGYAAGSDKEALVDAIISGDVQQLASDTAKYEAAVLSLVFRSGKMEGQTGNAMSNADFVRLQTMLDVKGDFAAFEETLRRYMGGKIKSYDALAGNIMEMGLINSFKENYGYTPVKAPLNFKDFVTSRSDPELQTAYDNTVSFVPSQQSSSIETPTVNNLEKWVNSGNTILSDEIPVTVTDFNEEYNKLSTLYPDAEQLLKAQKDIIAGMAGLLNTTPEKFKQLMGI